MAHSQQDATARRHALWSLTVLVLLAVLVVAVTLFFSGTPGSRHDDRIELGIPTSGPTTPRTAAPTVSTASPPGARSSTPVRRDPGTGARHSTASSPTGTSAPASTRAPSPALTRPAGNVAVADAPCTGSTPCLVAGDGGIAAALNASRHAHGTGPAGVAVTSLAQRCAASGGAECPGQYAIQTADAPSGRQAVASLAASPGNDWLFGPGTVSLQAGWAYLPNLHQYVVALMAQ